MQELFRCQIADKRATQKKLSFELGKNREQLTKMQMETAKTLTGTSFIHRRIWQGSSKPSKRESGRRKRSLRNSGKKRHRNRGVRWSHRSISSSSHGRRNLTQSHAEENDSMPAAQAYQGRQGLQDFCGNQCELPTVLY